MPGRLNGKTALVTGAARGIGRAIASRMLHEGSRVAIADIDTDAAAAAAAAAGEGAMALRLDVTQPAHWHEAVAATVAAFGGLSILVNNAGICIPGTVEEIGEDDWDRTMDVDLKSVYLGCRAAMPSLARHAPASIVNVSSISGLVAGYNLAAYNAAKAGVHLLTKSVALHCARAGYGVRCNSIHPAFIDTGMVDDIIDSADPQEVRRKLARQIPLGRIGTADDVAWAAVYLASEEAAFVTGAELKLDGGLSAM